VDALFFFPILLVSIYIFKGMKGYIYNFFNFFFK
jgi:hypothetical protein